MQLTYVRPSFFTFNPPLSGNDAAGVKGTMHDVLKASPTPNLFCLDYFISGCIRQNCKMRHATKGLTEAKTMLTSFKRALGNAYTITLK